MDEQIRRRVLADFLRKRRENIDPANVGLARGSRRRTPGLRREEVAVLAGMSPTWYTYLEQARNVSPSPQTLDVLAEIFGLSNYERIYLSRLTHRNPRLVQADEDCAGDQLWWQLSASLDPIPAFSCSRFGDVLSWNDAVTDWYTDFSLLPEERRNLLMWLFTAPEARVRFPDWAAEARAQVAHLRRASAGYYGDRRMEWLIQQISEASPQFTQWWNEHLVHAPSSRVTRMRHARNGIISMRIVDLWTELPGSAKVVIHLPTA